MKWLLLVLGWLLPLAAQAAPGVRDDRGLSVRLQRPAQRIISLAPHATELLFAAGGGARLVGTVEWSDWPPAARQVPRIGDSRSVDVERVLALRPDLLLLWDHGGNAALLRRLEDLGIPVFYSSPRTLEDMISSIERLGLLLGTQAQARPVAQGLRQRVQQLRRQYAQRSPVPVFYQVWHQPLMTLGGASMLGDVLQLCGGRSIFPELQAPAPVVEREAVLARNPEAIISSTRGARRDAGLLAWQRWPQLLAVKNANLLALEADHMDRPGPRLLDGAQSLCEQLEQVRGRRRR